MLPRNLIEHLSTQRKTLRKLHLNFRVLKYHWVVGERPEDLIPSLQSFSVLEDLLLNPVSICSNKNTSPENDDVLVRLLPPSIVNLCLADNANINMFSRLAGALHHLAAVVAKGQFPQFKTITCFTEQVLDDCNIQDVFSASGVKLTTSRGLPYAAVRT
jgi:hypothetical protein